MCTQRAPVSCLIREAWVRGKNQTGEIAEWADWTCRHA